MKKTLILLLCAMFFQFNSKASGQDVYVYNNTDCDIAITLTAACPDEDPCVEYGCFCSYYVPANTSLINPPGIASFFPSPTCTDWEWYKAEVQIFCQNNDYYYTFGRK